MSTLIETVYENGVFRPLSPVSLVEHQHVNIRLEEAASVTAAWPRHLPCEYLNDDASPLEDLVYQPVPRNTVGTMNVKYVFTGQHVPPVYPEE